jgi:hypothetical protein
MQSLSVLPRALPAAGLIGEEIRRRRYCWQADCVYINAENLQRVSRVTGKGNCHCCSSTIFAASPSCLQSLQPSEASDTHPQDTRTEDFSCKWIGFLFSVPQALEILYELHCRLTVWHGPLPLSPSFLESGQKSRAPHLVHFNQPVPLSTMHQRPSGMHGGDWLAMCCCWVGKHSHHMQNRRLLFSSGVGWRLSVTGRLWWHPGIPYLRRVISPLQALRHPWNCGTLWHSGWESTLCGTVSACVLFAPQAHFIFPPPAQPGQS